jgi:hypothetical protein
MAANGISTLVNKEDRRIAKLNLAAAKRQLIGTPGYRVLNYYVGTAGLIEGRPWSTFAPIPSGSQLDAEDGTDLVTEDGNNIVTE